MASKIETDIKRILAITWKDDFLKPKSIEEIARYWSLNLQWLNPEDAIIAATQFSEKGWLKIEGEGYIPAIKIQGTIAPLGWWPKASTFMAESQTKFVKNGTENNSASKIENENIEDSPVEKYDYERDQKIVKRMIRFVSSKSGIERAEIERRAKRKIAALGHITYKMSVILVAKEQGLDASDLMSLEKAGN